VSERVANVLSRRQPQLVHAMGSKPWTRSDSPPKLFRLDGRFKQRINSYYNFVMLEASPYLVAAKKLKREDLSGSAWLKNFSLGGKLFVAIGFSNINLTGLPLAVIDSSGKMLKRFFKISRFATDEIYFIKDNSLE